MCKDEKCTDHKLKLNLMTKRAKYKWTLLITSYIPFLI